MKRIGVDVGGTFTDLIYVDDETGTVLVHKVPTTAADPSQGTVYGIKELTAEAGEDASSLDQVFHGTTIATNIVIEHDGATVGLITTDGYRDILHIARHKKPLNFSNYQDLPWQRYPIVRRRYRLTVPERITKDGSVLVPLDEERAREQVRRLKEAEVDSVAVFKNFKLHMGLRMLANDEKGQTKQMAWVRSVAERKGRFKIYSTTD